MSYEEKGVWAYLISSAGAYGGYLAIVLGRAAHTPLPQVSYVSALLLAFGVSIVISVVVRVVLETARPSDSRRRDVRDRQIYRLGEYAGHWFVIGGATAALLMAMARWEYFWIANVIYLGFVLGTIVGSVVKLVAYRRGL